MRKFFVYIAVFIIMLAIVSSGLMAQSIIRQKPRPAPQPVAPAEKIGVTLEGQFIAPGDLVMTLFSAIGMPDKIKAMRGKEKDQDYVMLSYYTYGIIIDIHNEKNTIQGILVQDNKIMVSGVPFQVGDNAANVKQLWGKPEAEYTEEICYWKKGVYVGIDGTGKISHLFLVEPNSDFQKEGRGQVGKL